MRSLDMQGNEQLAIIIPKLREIGAQIDAGQLGSPTPCDDFTVAGVLDHMTALASGFAPMFRGEEPSSNGPEPDQTNQLARFDEAMGSLLDAVQSPGALDRTLQTPFGEMPGAVFARLVAFDGLVHGWDLATATGQQWVLDDDLVAEVDRFARQAITEEMRDGDVFAAQQPPGPDASAVERLAAFSGRTTRGSAMTATIEINYTRGDLQQAVLEALVADGFDPDDLDPEALTPAEEFHTLGRAATVSLAEAASITAADRVIDIGSGLGGPARYLARVHGCQVLGVDLTAEFCEVATDLTSRVGLSDRVEIRQGNALALPVPDDSFDVAWTQHASMNIADKAGFYAEIRRVLHPGGRLAFFDLLSGPEQPIHFPVPWAEDARSSTLASVDQTRTLLAEAGLEVRLWEDLTADAIAFYAALAGGPPPNQHLGLHLLINDLPTKGANLKRNVQEGRLTLIRCVAEATT